MGNRLSKIYTRTGDDGSTGLGDGSRTPKDSARVEAYGTVDELNSTLGVLLACGGLPDDIRELLVRIQHALFDLGGELCVPGMELVHDADVTGLEQTLDHYNEDLPRLKEFILPGGGMAAAQCHIARTVCRRGAMPHRAHRLPPRRTPRGDAGARRKRATASRALPESTVRPAVRAGAGAGTRQRPRRSFVAARKKKEARRVRR